jgi:predicted ArsR family transcriptional regulator
MKTLIESAAARGQRYPMLARTRAGREQEVLELLKTPQTAAELARRAYIAPKTLQRYLSSLRARGLVEPRYRRRGVVWERISKEKLRPGVGETKLLELLAAGTLTTRELATRLGVSRPRVWQLLTPLVSRGVVEQAGVVHQTGRGRPAATFRLRAIESR